MPIFLREALTAFRRSPFLVAMSVVAVSLSLFVVGLFALTAYNIRVALEQIEARVEVVAYLAEGTTLEQVRVAEAELRALPEVLELRYISSTEALAVALQELPEFREVLSGVDVNPLPASFEIRLQPGYRTTEAIELLAQRALAYPFVEDVEFGRDWVAKVMTLQQIAGGATRIIGGAFAGVAGIIIATAVRIGVFARREEIEIMRLVGATEGFIRGPFLAEGFLAGLVGGLVAALLTLATFEFVNLALLQVEWIPTSWLVATVGVGALYGLASSAIAVRRHLRAV